MYSRLLFFFFSSRRRHTRFDCDWSSDVCSSDLFRTIPSPSRPVFFEPSPCRPRSALYSGLKRKCTSVLWRSLDSIITSPPLPPSPPEGPPRGTYFSRRKATHPLPPSPALTRIFASSMNITCQVILVSGQWTATQNA